MAFITYPLNMVDYTAEDAELFHCTRNSGIYADDDFQCVASGVDNTITVGEGIGWIRNSKYSGKVFANKTAEVVDLGLADASLPRYDVIAIQFNKAQNLTKIVVKNGTPANSPKIPERSVTESIYELYLCKVYRPAGAVTITADNLTDTRLDAKLCGLMGDSVTSVDTSAIDAQVKALIENLEAEIQGVKDTSGLMHTSDWVENGVIPVNKGGTGATTAAEARNALGLGNTTEALPIANGGTGATTASAAQANIVGLTTQTFTKDNVAFSANSARETTINVEKPGYTPIAINGLKVDSATDKGENPSYLMIGSFSIENNTVVLFCRNLHTSGKAKVKLKITVAYRKS